MLESPIKRKKLSKKSPVAKLSKSSSILKSNGKTIGRQRLRQVTRWDTFDADTAGECLKQNSGMLDRSRFRTPTNKLEKIDF